MVNAWQLKITVDSSTELVVVGPSASLGGPGGVASSMQLPDASSWLQGTCSVFGGRSW